ncbi:hypothetical protein [Streptomyces sp. CB01881]|uniref:hypothetical protein n=1 Tax=Streptomyces sp. CB01881 TaxID=2078691 RepID=UPI0011DFDE9C|nr:hypothetical protein [Streptomyces sp. CB01881]TYC73880.1 hypothetical protein EH183_17815 [Streptomyces sp. CB01881]
MARTSPSPADARLIEYARSQGVEVTARQLERWRGKPDPLLPRNERSWPGRPVGGSSSTADGEIGELVAWLGKHQKQGRSRDHLILGAFAAGLRVPESSVRSAFGRHVIEMAADLRKNLGPLLPGADPDDWVGDGASRIALEQQHRGAGVNRRIRKIDKSLRELPALAEFWPTIGALDGSAGAEPLDNAGLAFHSVLGILLGADGIMPETIARVVRSRSGVSDLNPGAYLLETDNGDPLQALRDAPAHQVPGLPESSMLHHLHSLVLDTPLERLRAAWQAAGTLATWAEDLCAAVETEIAYGLPGPASEKWIYGMLFSLSRDLIRVGLAEPNPTPSQQCSSALSLLFVAGGTEAALALADEDGRHRADLLTPAPLRPLVAGLPAR